MAGGERVIENECSRLGLRVVHVVRYGTAVEAGPYLELVPLEAAETVRVMQRCDELRMQHLYVMWKAREMVQLRIGQREPVTVAVWWIGKVDGKPVPLRQAAAQAACVYEMACGCWPSTAWVRTLPAGATDSFEIFDGQQLRLEQVAWGLGGFVVVGRG